MSDITWQQLYDSAVADYTKSTEQRTVYDLVDHDITVLIEDGYFEIVDSADQSTIDYRKVYSIEDGWQFVADYVNDRS